MRALLSILAIFLVSCGTEKPVDNGESVPKLYPAQEARYVKADLREQAIRTDFAVKVMIKLACVKLHELGKDQVCDDIQGEYDARFDGFLLRQVELEDLGDHEPLSLWLAVVYGILEQELGTLVMQALHLDDLNIINFGVPVTFNPKASEQWCVETTDKPCKDEYGLHAVPLMGVTAYWASYAGCVGATWGAGLIMICTPVGMAAEYLTVKWVAPKVSARIYDRANPAL